MFYLFLTIYIAIATYYLIGILDCYDDILEKDPALKLFNIKCKSAKLFACGLILLISYLWPIGLLLKPYVKAWLKKNILPRKVDFHERGESKERFSGAT